jgi:hypothetical protein
MGRNGQPINRQNSLSANIYFLDEFLRGIIAALRLNPVPFQGVKPGVAARPVTVRRIVDVALCSIEGVPVAQRLLERHAHRALSQFAFRLTVGYLGKALTLCFGLPPKAATIKRAGHHEIGLRYRLDISRKRASCGLESAVALPRRLGQATPQCATGA